MAFPFNSSCHGNVVTNVAIKKMVGAVKGIMLCRRRGHYAWKELI